jgi:hypothetical protein
MTAAGGHPANGVDDEDGSASVGFDRPDHAAVFDLSMDYSDDDVLLDWEQYSGAHVHMNHTFHMHSLLVKLTVIVARVV